MSAGGPLSGEGDMDDEEKRRLKGSVFALLTGQVIYVGGDSIEGSPPVENQECGHIAQCPCQNSDKCSVCGDHATTHNFGAFTCASCKAFFRRTALSPKPFRCVRSGRCNLTPTWRRCQRCRLDKCYLVGMKKEWIDCRRRGWRWSKNVYKEAAAAAAAAAAKGRPRSASDSSTSSSTSPTRTRSESAPEDTTSLSGSTDSKTPSGDDIMMQQHQRKQSIDKPVISEPREPIAVMNPEQFRARSVIIAPPSQQDPLPDQPRHHQQIVPAAGSSGLSSAGHFFAGPIMAWPIFTPQFAALLNSGGGDEQLTLKVEDFRRLLESAISQLNMKRPSMNSENSHGRIRSTVGDTDYTDLSACFVTKPETPQRTLPPEIQKQHQQFEKKILDALMAPDDDIQSPNSAFEAYVPPGGDMRLNPTELRAIEIVSEAFQALDDCVSEQRHISMLLKKQHGPADILNIMDITMRRFVNVARKLPAFNDLSQEGKVAVLREGMVKLLMLHGVRRYCDMTKSFKTPVIAGSSANVSIDMFDGLNKQVNQVSKDNDIFSLCETVHREVRRDNTAIYLMMVITLFSPNLSKIHDPADVRTIKKHQQEYIFLTYQYLRSIHGVFATEIFNSVPKALKAMNNSEGTSKELFKDTVKPDEAESLPQEFYKISVAE
uniref:Nuclear receptor domain-containing protein n=1 Tax=Steinernema glaseri TaxID=37863 RepID=A0A1I7YWC9_9BILA